MYEKIKNLICSFLNLVYINKCLSCRKNCKDLICEDCRKEIDFLSPYPIKIYKNISVFACSMYEKTVKNLIRALKFSHQKRASIALADILFEYFKNLNLEKEFVIIYPAVYSFKKAQRGYNQVELIAKEFSKRTNFEIAKNLIKKVKYTKPQYQAKNRFKNIEGSFKVNEHIKEKYLNKPLLLIDDITTSGATIEEIINCLMNENITDITVVTLSKAGNK